MENVTEKRDAKLANIQAQLNRLEEQTETIGTWRANWGMVGDLGYVEDLLNQAVIFLAGYPATKGTATPEFLEELAQWYALKPKPRKATT